MLWLELCRSCVFRAKSGVGVVLALCRPTWFPTQLIEKTVFFQCVCKSLGLQKHCFFNCLQKPWLQTSLKKHCFLNAFAEALVAKTLFFQLFAKALVANTLRFSFLG